MMSNGKSIGYTIASFDKKSQQKKAKNLEKLD
jgi:hypothetical protein